MLSITSALLRQPCLSCDVVLDLFARHDLLCPDCALALDVLDSVHEPTPTLAACRYQNIAKKLVLELKQGRSPKAAVLMAEAMAPLVVNKLLAADCAYWPGALWVVPIPSSRQSWLTRGFNPAQDLAAALFRRLRRNSKLKSAACSPRFRPDVLVKTKDTLPQHELTYHQRIANPYGAFTIAPTIDARGEVILLVDDVCTTGSTLKEAARVLSQAGAADVLRIVFAQSRHDPQ